MKKLLNNKGFTLAEVLICVAIIGALVTISIPVFGGVLENAHTATCLDNRNNLQNMLTSIYLVDGDVAAEFNAKKASCACPDGGSLSYTQDPLSDDITVRCSIHTPGLTSDIVKSAVAKMILNAKNDKGNRIVVDSTAPAKNDSNNLSGATEKCKVALQAAGLDLGGMGVAAWRFNTGNMLFWTTVDITTLSPGDQFPVIRYNSGTGTFTVWTSKVEQKEAGNDTYNIISESVTPYIPSTGDKTHVVAKEDQNLTNAQDHYAKLLEDLNGANP